MMGWKLDILNISSVIESRVVNKTNQNKKKTVINSVIWDGSGIRGLGGKCKIQNGQCLRSDFINASLK